MCDESVKKNCILAATIYQFFIKNISFDNFYSKDMLNKCLINTIFNNIMFFIAIRTK